MPVTNGTPLSHLQVETAVRLYGSGMGCAAIGRELGRKASTIYSLLSRIGIIVPAKKTKPIKTIKIEKEHEETPRDLLAERLSKLGIKYLSLDLPSEGPAVQFHPEPGGFGKCCLDDFW